MKAERVSIFMCMTQPTQSSRSVRISSSSKEAVRRPGRLEGSEESVGGDRVAGADERLAQDQVADLPSDAPSATSRAASIPCVSGSTSLIACIHAGSSSSGTLTPQKSSSPM